MTTLRECLWETIRGSDAAGIMERHEALKSADEEIHAWHAGLHARFNELLATAKSSGKIKDAEAAQKAYQNVVGADIVMKAVCEGHSRRAYVYISDRAHLRAFERLGKTLLKRISSLPPTKSKSEARDRRSMYQRIQHSLREMENGCFGMSTGGMLQGLALCYGKMPTKPPQQHKAPTDPDISETPIPAPQDESFQFADRIPAVITA